MIKVFSLLVVLAAGIFLAGCAMTLHYVPSIHPVDPALVPDLKGDEAVCVVNISTATGETVLGISNEGSGQTCIMGDLHKWTNTAAALLMLELQKRGFIIRDCGEDTKAVKLAIKSVHIEMDVGSRCYVTLYLETGDGYNRNYVSYNAFPTADRASDGAVIRAIIAVLNDKKIIDYLQAADARGTGGSP